MLHVSLSLTILTLPYTLTLMSDDKKKAGAQVQARRTEQGRALFEWATKVEKTSKRRFRRYLPQTR